MGSLIGQVNDTILSASYTARLLTIDLVMPETKARTLEELDAVFSVSTHEQVAHGLKQIPWFIQRYIFRNKNAHLPPLVDFDKAETSKPVEEVA